jgi:hypothetical protein
MLYVAAGKSVTSRRGTICGGDEDSAVTWRDFCRDATNPELVELAKRQIPRLCEIGTLVDSITIPISAEEIARREALDKITNEVDLNRPIARSHAGKSPSVKQRALDVRADMAAASERRVQPPAETEPQAGAGETEPDPNVEPQAGAGEADAPPAETEPQAGAGEADAPPAETEPQSGAGEADAPLAPQAGAGEADAPLAPLSVLDGPGIGGGATRA